MRFIHTADWHLGRIFHGVRLTDDQQHVLEQLVRLVGEAEVDALIVAGDVYDRAVPPPDAVALLDDVLSRVVLEKKVRAVVIAGNHDGPDRLAFGSRILAERGLHVVGVPEAAPSPLRFGDPWGTVDVFSAPFADPATVRACLGRDDLHDHDAAMGAWLENVRSLATPGARTVLVGHAFVQGAAESESERPLSVGGAGTVAATRFAGFSYVALGHLHRPQEIVAPGLAPSSVAYSGSLLKYSFSEVDHLKSVSVVDIDDRGRVGVERVALSPRRDLRCIEGTLDEVIGGAARDPARDDYLRITLTDRGALLDPMGKLRAVYPNVLEIERPALFDPLAASDGTSARAASADHRRLGEVELFESFFREVTGEPLDEAERSVLAEIVDLERRRERDGEGDQRLDHDGGPDAA